MISLARAARRSLALGLVPLFVLLGAAPSEAGPGALGQAIAQKFGGDVDCTTTAPTNNQALVFSTTTGKWGPGTVSGGVTSVHGTPSQVDVSGTTGSVTLSLPSSVTLATSLTVPSVTGSNSATFALASANNHDLTVTADGSGQVTLAGNGIYLNPGGGGPVPIYGNGTSWKIGAGGVWGWSSQNPPTAGAADVGFSRLGPASLALGDATAGTTSGTLALGAIGLGGSSAGASSTITGPAIDILSSGNLRLFSNGTDVAYAGAGFHILSGGLTLDNPNGDGVIVAGSTISTGMAGSQGALAIYGTTSGHVTLGVNAVAGTASYKLPALNGSSGQVLTEDGSGGLSWTDVSGAAGSLNATLAIGATTGGKNPIVTDGDFILFGGTAGTTGVPSISRNSTYVAFLGNGGSGNYAPILAGGLGLGTSNGGSPTAGTIAFATGIGGVSQIKFPTDQTAWLSGSTAGNFLFTNAAGSDLNQIQLGGTTSSFPSLQRSGTLVNFLLADNTAYTPIRCAGIGICVGGNGATPATTGQISWGGNTGFDTSKPNIVGPTDGTFWISAGAGQALKLGLVDSTTGAGTVTGFGGCPAITLNAPYTWLRMTSDDGSTVYVGAYK